MTTTCTGNGDQLVGQVPADRYLWPDLNYHLHNKNFTQKKNKTSTFVDLRELVSLWTFDIGPRLVLHQTPLVATAEFESLHPASSIDSLPGSVFP